MKVLKQSTASQSVKIGPFVDDTDGATPETALSIANTDIKLSKNGASYANKNSGGGTHDANGMYTVTFDATDTNTVGRLEYSVKVAGALSVWGEFWVLEEAIYDALFAASAAAFDSNQRVDVGSVGGTAQTANDNGADINAILADTNELQTNQGNWLTATGFSTHSAADVWTSVTRTLTANTNFNDPTAAAIADAVLDEALSGHLGAGSLGKAVADIETDATAILLDTGTTLPATLATIEGKIDTIDGIVDAILVDTGTTLDGKLNTIDGIVDSILVDTGTTIPAQIAALNNISVSDILTTQMTESYNVDGAAPTLAQALHLLIAINTDFVISGTTLTARKLDGSTTAATFTLDDGTNPTSLTRAT